MSFFYDNCTNAKFLLLSKEKVADGGTRTNKFAHIFRRRMTDKVNCFFNQISETPFHQLSNNSTLYEICATVSHKSAQTQTLSK